MAAPKARTTVKLLNILNRQLNSSPTPSITSIATRNFSDFRRNPDGFNSQPPEPLPRRSPRGQKPFNSSFREPRRPENARSRDDFFDSRKKRDDSDNSFLERFKLGLNNNKEQTPSKNPDSGAAEASEIPKQEEKIPEPENADEIFKKMKETGLIPNAVAMLDGLCKDGLVQEALKLFGLMREKGTIPEVVIYTAVVDGFCKAHKVDDAKRVFRKMESPNAFSYGVLIQGLCKCGNLDDAVEFSLEMLEAGHSLNVITFVGLIGGLCKEKGVEEAKIVIADLKQKGFDVNNKAVREFLDKKAPFSPLVWEAIFGNEPRRKTSSF